MNEIAGVFQASLPPKPLFGSRGSSVRGFVRFADKWFKAMTKSKTSTTAVLKDIAEGDPSALDRLWPLVHDELRRLAGHYLKNERPGHTLQPTDLVHEAFMRFVELKEIQFESRAHFFAMAATIMRRVLINHARGKRRQKRGGSAIVVTLNEELMGKNRGLEDLLVLDEAMSLLATEDERAARVVELRVFGGLEIKEIALTLDISPATVKRDWEFGKAWLYRELQAK